jgi:hypothetical protein
MQTVVQNQNSVRFGSGILALNGVNLGLLKDAKSVVTRKVLEYKAHNGRLAPRVKIDSIKFTATLVELDLDNLDNLDGHGVLSNTANSPVSVTQELVKSSGWVQGTPLKLANKNGANTVVTSIVIKAGTTYGGASTLTLNTDYRVFVGNGTNGELGATYITPITSQSNNIYADYSYTPNLRKTITWSDVAKIISTNEATFTNTDENGKTFKITIPEAYNSGNIDFAFASDDEIDKTAEMQLELTAYPDAQNRLMYLEDEQAVA